MDRLAAMALFVRVVETASFSRTAREFATTQPTVTKQIAAIEARLQVRLLNRNTRGVSPTEAGSLYYEKCKAIVRATEEADQIMLAPQGAGAEPVVGQLRISTSVAFGRRVILPLALEFMAQHAQIQLDLSFDDRYVDLVAQGMDVALRMGRLADSSLGARFLGMNPWVLVASPAYLAQQGRPRQANELAQHAALVYSSVQGDEVWRLSTPKGATVAVPVSGRLRSNNLSTVLAAARNGLGIAAVPRYVAADSLATGHVVELLADHSLPAQELHAVFPSPKLVPPKVTAFIDFLLGRFGPRWWDDLPRA